MNEARVACRRTASPGLTTILSLVLLSIVAFSACFSSPDPNLYALYPQAGTKSGAPALRVELRRPNAPGYLDRPQIVRRVGPGRLDLAGNDWWGSPFEEMVGTTMALNQVATVSAPEPRLLVVTPFDKGQSKAIEKAIRDASLGLDPAQQGGIIRVPLPSMNEERRRELVKVVHKYAEDGKIAIRHARTHGRAPKRNRRWCKWRPRARSCAADHPGYTSRSGIHSDEPHLRGHETSPAVGRLRRQRRL